MHLSELFLWQVFDDLGSVVQTNDAVTCTNETIIFSGVQKHCHFLAKKLSKKCEEICSAKLIFSAKKKKKKWPLDFTYTRELILD